ncbi:MAG: 1-(5-phosphoribosyl)-5-[(5-phosphoribosylamino)methylideneamino]imidazole-4-carboxamide isomerase [Christensenellales bacterium]
MKEKAQMIVYPAVDIKDGKCVRLRQGKADDASVYADDPAVMAKRWADAGAAALHVVDLDGAFGGEGKNLAAVERIVKIAGIPVQLGGGIRTIEDMALRLEEIGVKRVILGTVAVERPDLVEEAARRWPGRIVVGIDAKDGRVTTRGWVRTEKVSPIELALEMKALGIDTIIYTDIARDGMLSGIGRESTKALIDATGMHIIASGGVGSLSDIAEARQIGARGVIVGKALYDGAIHIKDALAQQEASI